MTREQFREWATPLAVLVGAVAICGTTAAGDLAVWRQERATTRAVESASAELYYLRMAAR